MKSRNTTQIASILKSILISSILLLPVNASSATVYLKEGGTIDCQSFWKNKSGVHVKVNEGLVVDLQADEVDITKTFRKKVKPKVKVIKKNNTLALERQTPPNAISKQQSAINRVTTYPSAGNKLSQIEQALKDTVNDINMRVPIMLDSNTRLDGVMTSKKTLMYKFTLINVATDLYNIKMMRAAKEPELINNLCTSKDTSITLRGGANYIYMYFDENGRELIRYDIDRSSCNF